VRQPRLGPTHLGGHGHGRDFRRCANCGRAGAGKRTPRGSIGVANRRRAAVVRAAGRQAAQAQGDRGASPSSIDAVEGVAIRCRKGGALQVALEEDSACEARVVQVPWRTFRGSARWPFILPALGRGASRAALRERAWWNGGGWNSGVTHEVLPVCVYISREMAARSHSPGAPPTRRTGISRRRGAQRCTALEHRWRVLAARRQQRAAVHVMVPIHPAVCICALLSSPAAPPHNAWAAMPRIAPSEVPPEARRRSPTTPVPIPHANTVRDQRAGRPAPAIGCAGLRLRILELRPGDQAHTAQYTPQPATPPAQLRAITLLPQARRRLHSWSRHPSPRACCLAAPPPHQGPALPRGSSRPHCPCSRQRACAARSAPAAAAAAGRAPAARAAPAAHAHRQLLSLQLGVDACAQGEGRRGGARVRAGGAGRAGGPLGARRAGGLLLPLPRRGRGARSCSGAERRRWLHWAHRLGSLAAMLCLAPAATGPGSRRQAARGGRPGLGRCAAWRTLAPGTASQHTGRALPRIAAQPAQLAGPGASAARRAGRQRAERMRRRPARLVLRGAQASSEPTAASRRRAERGRRRRRRSRLNMGAFLRMSGIMRKRTWGKGAGKRAGSRSAAALSAAAPGRPAAGAGAGPAAQRRSHQPQAAAPTRAPAASTSARSLCCRPPAAQPPAPSTSARSLCCRPPAAQQAKGKSTGAGPPAPSSAAAGSLCCRG
jgi:hypothetical protein